MTGPLATVGSDIPGNEPWLLGPGAPESRGHATRARLGDAGVLVPCGDTESLAERLASLGADHRADERVARGMARVRAEAVNLSRGWMLQGSHAGLPEDDPRPAGLSAAADVHRAAGLAAVTGEHYEGGHWLGSFAIYLVSGKGR